MERDIPLTQSVSENVRQDLIKLVPASIMNLSSCFTFYDNHPRDKKNIDIIIVTKFGEVKEFFKREMVKDVALPMIKCNPSKITLFRNSKCDLFYIISVGDELFVLSRNENLQIKKRITNVDCYEVNDTGCRGIPCLKVVKKYDAIPLIFDENMESMREQAIFLEQFQSHDTVPLIKDLMRKLVEVKYAVKANEKAYKELLALRQRTAYSNYENRNPNLIETLFNNKNQLSGAMKVKTPKPWVKVCNRKVIVVTEVFSEGTQTLEDVHILLHHTIKSTIVYKSRLFIKTSIEPYWQELESQNLNQKTDAALVCTIDLEDLKHSITNKIQLSAVICYKYKNKECLLPLEDVIVSATDVMGEDFDVLHNIEQHGKTYGFLALLATTEKFDVYIRLIESTTESDFDIKSLFKTILKLESLYDSENIFVHRISPFHILHGVMVILETRDVTSFLYNVSIHARNESQVLALIHYINDSFPCRVIITPINYKITSKTEELSQYNEDVTRIVQNQNTVEFGEAVLKQSVATLEYLDQCMIKMNENKDPSVQSKLGSEIDVFADGVESFKKFRNKMLEEADKGTVCISSRKSAVAESSGMVIEIDD